MGIGIFASGVLEVLDNFVTKTILTILFLIIIANIIITLSRKKKEE